VDDEFAGDVAAIGALDEPARRDLYLYVVSQPDAVSREQAATAVGVPLHSAKFHLDRLVEQDLLSVEFRRLSGKAGPGAGRPSKLYRRSSRQLSVSLPERHYDLAGDILASAIDSSLGTGVAVARAVREAATAEGRRLASTFVAESEGLASTDLDRAAEVLARHGYEPRTVDGDVRLANCPFDRLAADHTDLVCAMNLALIGGVIEGLGASEVDAEPAPAPGFCCVRLTSHGTHPAAG
jgi:predicted ArsR family transcriptional regulator